MYYSTTVYTRTIFTVIYMYFVQYLPYVYFCTHRSGDAGIAEVRRALVHASYFRLPIKRIHRPGSNSNKYSQLKAIAQVNSSVKAL